MSADHYKKLAISALENARGDDLYRMQSHCRKFTLDQMKEQHGLSGLTRAEILAQYEKWDKDHTDAIAWLKGLS